MSLRAIEGKAAVDSEGVQHVTERPGVALCGEETVAYPLHWDTRTAFHCLYCIDVAAGGGGNDGE